MDMMMNYKVSPTRPFWLQRCVIAMAVMALASLMATAETPKTQEKPKQKQEKAMANVPTLEGAVKSLEAGAKLAQVDPDRPVFHFHPPARYMNDPNGPIFHKGWYHMFYQLNPFWDIHGGGTATWGHARSKDMVRWEQLPIAIFPSYEKGENACFSGTCTINEQGRPTIIYTSVHSSEYDDAEQWAATSDDEMINWKKLDANPVLTQALHGKEKIRHWRDPFSFKHEGRTYIVIGGSLWKGPEPHGAILLYRATNPDLTAWEYLGVVHEYADPRNYISEVPNLFPLGNKWVLISNPMAWKCIIGEMDFKTFKFHPETEAALTWGDYNIRVAQLDANPNRVILWGFIGGFQKQMKESKGWMNCMALPRVLSMRENGELEIEPLDALKTLRGRLLAAEGDGGREGKDAKDITLNSASRVVAGVAGDCLEIQASLIPQGAGVSGIKVRCSSDQSRYVAIQFETPTPSNKGPHLVVNGVGMAGPSAKIPFDLAEGEKSVDLKVYLDKSVIEVFVNGRATWTGVMELHPEDQGVALFAEGGAMAAKDVKVWEMKPIW